MGLSWGGLFALSYLPWKRSGTKAQLKKEIRAQIERVRSAFREYMDNNLFFTKLTGR